MKRQMSVQEELMKKHVEDISYRDWGDEVDIRTYCRLTLKNGFEITGTSVCFDPADYDNELGKYYALHDAVNRLWLIDDYMEYMQSKQLQQEQESGEEEEKA
jgi:hypothetical protein